MATYTLHSSGAETTNGVGSPVSVNHYEIVGVFTNVTAVSGLLATINIKLQHTPNGTDWYDVPNCTVGYSALGTFFLGVNSGNVGQKITDTIRLVWTVGGTNPHFTFSTDIVLL